MGEQSPVNLLMRERTWRDMTWGTLSSDGRRVFAIEDLGFWGLYELNPLANQQPRNQNRLTAYDLATGKIQWEIGGPRGDRQLDLARTFFLGAPLPGGGALYCLGA